MIVEIGYRWHWSDGVSALGDAQRSDIAVEFVLVDAVRLRLRFRRRITTMIPVTIAPYHVVPGDELAVPIFGAPELGSTGLVDSAGNFAHAARRDLARRRPNARGRSAPRSKKSCSGTLSQEPAGRPERQAVGKSAGGDR